MAGEIRPGCGQKASVLYKMDTSIGLLDRANDPRESTTEAALSDGLAFHVTHHHFLSILLVTQTSLIQCTEDYTRT